MARKRDGNFSRVFAWRLAVRDDPDLSPQARALVLVLSTYMDEEGECYPSQDLLAAGAGFGSVRSVNTYLRELVGSGFLLVEARMTPGGRRNTYRASVPFAQFLT